MLIACVNETGAIGIRCPAGSPPRRLRSQSMPPATPSNAALELGRANWCSFAAEQYGTSLAVGKNMAANLFANYGVLASAVSRAELTRAEIALSDVWRLLISGALVIRKTFAVGERSLAVLTTQPFGHGESQSRASDGALLQRAFAGERLKVLAGAADLSISTVSNRCAGLLESMGCDRSIARVPVLVPMAALAAHGLAIGGARVEGLAPGAPVQWLVSVTNPAHNLRHRLSSAEYQVARLAIDGKSHADIALARGTAQRTIANQLASMSRKLRVSGRAELRALAIREQPRP